MSYTVLGSNLGYLFTLLRRSELDLGLILTELMASNGRLDLSEGLFAQPENSVIHHYLNAK